MADYAEEIAKRIAERKSRHRYWPEGEPGSRRDRDRGHGKREGKSEKWSLDPRFKPKTKAEPEKLESISEFVKKERTRRLERALKTMEERRVVPKDVPLKKWLSDPENLKRAQKRGMVKKIAKRANPKSRDTDDIVTVGGSRYAKTDLYRAPLREKASEIVLKTKFGSEMWWDRNKKVVFVAAVSLVAGFMAYTVWKNKQLQQDVARRRVRNRALAARPSAQHAGLLAVPSHHWHRHRPRYFSGPPSPWNHWGHHHGYTPWGRNPWHWRAGAHGGAGGAGHGGGGAAHGGGGVAHGGGGGALGHGGMMQGHGGGAFHGAHHGFGHEGWGGLGGWGGGGWGGWGDWNLGYPDDASLWGDPFDTFDPYASWW